MKNFLDGLAGMLMVSADRARNRRTLRRIQEANEQNQGIVRYAPSQIEAFLDDAAPTGDLLISGGANAIRVRAVCRAIECACQQGYSVMVLHAGNSELEQGLWGYFGGSGVCLVNRGNPVLSLARLPKSKEFARDSREHSSTCWTGWEFPARPCTAFPAARKTGGRKVTPGTWRGWTAAGPI